MFQEIRTASAQVSSNPHPPPPGKKSQTAISGEPGALISRGQEKMHPSIRREEICPSFFLLYWDLQKIGEGGSLHWVYHIKCYSAPEMPSQIHPEIMTEQLCEPLLGQSSGHTKLTVTVINSTNYSCSWILHHSTKNTPSGQGLLHLSNGVLPRHQALFNVLKKRWGVE